ncbi:LLM class flavin-dependent oxidoreductase [Geodermatophilus ruber]|uniref:Probable F420-dependent oxidoreductase, MSMEG_2256 family n=1 Tax=Geodermatophilus ruber TaxID=504800 RepID=A0A1I4JNF6_9ACTN|nr:LLM class flavin-dependent oxidoreductase [Geodermatophilus ruber]SFL68128.1 probable F420-dependent oxidoreductase, MSMEG_2256 family [Geodermatophilus ruber]
MDDRRPRLGVLLNGENMSLAEAIDFGVSLEDAGFDSVWHAEVQVDPIVPLAAIAARTTRIRIGTGVAVWTRSPVTAALTAANLDELSGGRFRFGLGTSPKLFNELFYGLPYERPAQSMGEYIAAIRSVWRAHSGGAATHEGSVERFRIGGFPRTVPQEREDIPIYLAAVGQGMLRVAGATAEGVLLNVLTAPRYLHEYAFEHLAAGAAERGRSLEDLDKACVVLTSISDDGDRAREWARQTIAWYSVQPYFDTTFRIYGFEREAAAAREAAARGDVEAQTRAVSDEMVATYAIAGTPEECRSRLAVYGDLDEVVLVPTTIGLSAEERVENLHNTRDAFRIQAGAAALAAG